MSVHYLIFRWTAQRRCPASPRLALVSVRCLEIRESLVAASGRSFRTIPTTPLRPGPVDGGWLEAFGAAATTSCRRSCACRCFAAITAHAASLVVASTHPLRAALPGETKTPRRSSAAHIFRRRRVRSSLTGVGAKHKTSVALCVVAATDGGIFARRRQCCRRTKKQNY